MLKRISLVFMLLTALISIVGVQAQKTAQPQSMAKYLPSDTEIFFSIRTDGAFIDELDNLISGVVQKLPEAVASQAQMISLKSLLESQVGPLSETGIGDYVALSFSNLTVLYDQDRTNDSQIVFYLVASLNDRTKYETFFEHNATNMQKSDENGVSVYTTKDGPGKLFVTDDIVYVTNTTAMPSGAMLNSSSKFNETLARLPEPNYNFIAYADLSGLFTALKGMTIAQLTNGASVTPGVAEIWTSTIGDLSQAAPIVVGGTVLDDKSLVIDAFTPSLKALTPNTPVIDPTFANNIPAGFNFVVQGTDLKTSLNSVIDLAFKTMYQDAYNKTSRADVTAQLKAFLGLDLDTDILGWMGGNYAIIGNLDMRVILDGMQNGTLRDAEIDPHFAFIVEGDGSDKPAKVANAIGTLLVAQTKDMPGAPKINLTTEEGSTTVVIEGISVPETSDKNMALSIEIVGNKDLFVVGDQATVDAILSGTGARLSGDEGFVQAQKYILPKASTIAYAGSEGWGDLLTVAGMAKFTHASSALTPSDETKLLASVLSSTYDMIGSSSLSIAYNDDGSQNSRLVLTLK